MKKFDKPCNQCLMSRAKIVSEKRAEQVVNTCIKQNKHFSCHKATIKGQDIACPGFLRKHGSQLTGYNLVEQLGLVEVVPLDKFLDDERV